MEKLVPNKFILFTKIADITVDEDGRIGKRANQWTGGAESYELEENDGKVKLSTTQDVPNELAEYFESTLPKVLERIKALAETK